MGVIGQVKPFAVFGLDVTPDGLVWINMNKVGNRSDFAVLGEDFLRNRNPFIRAREVWIRGYHRLDPALKYRTSKALYLVDCDRRTLWRKAEVTYLADGSTYSTDNRSGGTQPVVPGSIGDTWFRFICQ